MIVHLEGAAVEGYEGGGFGRCEPVVALNGGVGVVVGCGGGLLVFVGEERGLFGACHG